MTNGQGYAEKKGWFISRWERARGHGFSSCYSEKSYNLKLMNLFEDFPF